MKKIICIIFLVVISPSVVPAAELYTWTNEQGVICISDTPPVNQKPTRTMTYQKEDPAEIERWERKRKAAYKQQEAIREANERREAKRLAKEARESEAREAARKAQAKANQRREKEEKTDQISKRYWDEVKRSIKNHTTVSDSLREEYKKAIDEDPRTLKSILTIESRPAR